MDPKLPSDVSFLGKKIIVAEDEEINFLFLETVLSRAGATVYHAWNGSQVLELINEIPDVFIILMDIKMPIMNGYDATRAVKKINPDIKVIAQTAYALGDDKYKCLDAGCDDYMAKPIQKNLLFALMEKYLPKEV